MKRFDYIRPGNMEDAIAALQANAEPYLLAGGTDLLIGMKTKAVRAEMPHRFEGNSRYRRH